MNDAIWLGIDLGTQSVRVLAVSATGETLGIGSHPLTSRRDGPRHEQDPGDWWTAVAAASRAALRDLAVERIRGVAVDATSGTVLLVDARGNAATPALMYDDTRATAETTRANEIGGELWSALGYHRMQAAWGLPKLLWLLKHSRETIPPDAQLAHQSDFVTRRLCGTATATDASNALKTGCDLRRDEWPHFTLEKLGVPPAMLPKVVRSGSRIGTVGAAAAAETLIPKGTPVIAGMTDGCAAQLGAGALAEGSWNSVLGTTLVLKGSSRDLVHDPLGVVYSHRSPDGRWLPGGASSVGAGAITAHFAGRDLDALGARAAERGPASSIAYPLTGRGERFPFSAPDAHGFLLGDPMDEVAQYSAITHGVAYVERLCFDYLAMLGAPTNGDLMLTGGGAKNRLWNQLRADVLGRAVKLPENPEAALGMAVLAAAEGRDIAMVAAEMVRIRETIDPRTEHTHSHRENYQRLITALAARGWLPAHVAAFATR